MNMTDWRDHIPQRLGDLPLGGDLRRTDPGGRADAPIAILGVYPALTKMGRFQSKAGPINVPTVVETTSFEPTSSSGREIDQAYLEPLGLTRRDVFMVDMAPYFLANTAKTGKAKRSMWDNVQTYDRESGHKTAVRPRPEPNELLAECRSMPGNMDRLAELLGQAPRRLLLTLGNEAAAFVRGDAVATDAQPFLLGEPRRMDFVGLELEVVHLPHPGIVMKHEGWRERHRVWCQEQGTALVGGMLG